MALKLIIKPAAEDEILEAIQWYDQQREGLSLELLQSIDDVLERIKKNPEYFQERYREIRIVFTKRFPYGIHYTVEKDTIHVHAVLHTKRKPRT